MSVAEEPLRRAVFLDRDGTLNVDPGYISDPKQIEVYLGVAAGLRRLSERGYLLVVITNQSGVSRGYYTHETVEALHQRIREILARRGAAIDAFYYCPHAPHEHCGCRKPGTELFERAARDHRIDLERSAVIGNMELDVEAGRRLGLLTAYVRSPGFYLEPDPGRGYGADIVAPNFLAACEAIVTRDPDGQRSTRSPRTPETKA